MKNPNTKKPKLNPDQIRGQIASMQSELSKLEREHAAEQQAFQERVGARLKLHNELTGGISALQALIA